MKETMEPEKHLPLAPRDLLVLSVLAEGPLHGYGIIKAVEARSQAGVLLDPANLYRVLRRMTRLGWIRQAETADASRTGSNAEARRKTYAITPTGRALLTAELARIERLLEYARPAVAGGPNSSAAGIATPEGPSSRPGVNSSGGKRS
jgi:DNA-binding PadR family transcriptional regulator